MKILRATSLATFIAALSACMAKTEDAPTGYELCSRTGVFRTNDGIVRICAPITQDVVDQVSRTLTPDDREVILTSDGGAQIHAIQLAELLRQRDITVRVRQFCLSACSTYVMGMVNRVVVEPYTVVAFHHTAAFALDAVAARTGMSDDSSVRRASRSERAAYRAAGRDDRMLDRIAMTVEPTCVSSREVGGRPEVVINYRWQWYMPDFATAQAIFGDRLSGDWLEDEDMAKEIFRRSLDQPNATIKFGELAGGETRPEVVGPSLPACAS